MAPRPRQELGNILKDILQDGSVIQTYYQAPPNYKMDYPCVLYEHSDGNTEFADNMPYTYAKRYTITIIDRNPDSLIPDSVAQLPQCVFSRHYTADNLHHWVFNLYF